MNMTNERITAVRQTLLDDKASGQSAAESHDGTHRQVNASRQHSEGHADGSNGHNGGLKGDVKEIGEAKETVREQR